MMQAALVYSQKYKIGLPGLFKSPAKSRDPAIWDFNPDDFTKFIEKRKNRKLIIALSAGKFKLACHFPILRLMETLNIQVDELWGVSAGAIVGGFWSAGLNVKEIDAEIESLNLSMVFDLFNIKAIKPGLEAIRDDKPLKTAGIFPGLKIEGHLREILRKSKRKNPHIDLSNFYAVTYNISTFDKTMMQSGKGGEIIHHRQEQDGALVSSTSTGDLADIMRASMSMSGIYWPKKIGGEFFLDGGVCEHLPIKSPFAKWVYDINHGNEKRDLLLVAVEASYWDADSPPPPNPLSIISESFEILGVELSKDHEFYIRQYLGPRGQKVDLVILRPKAPYTIMTSTPDFEGQINATRNEIFAKLANR